jgi:uncharacterized protein
MLTATALHAGLLGLVFVWLATRVIKARRVHRVSLGTGHRLVERAVRAHGNFAEYVPFALLLLALCELNGLPAWAIHALGTALLVGRVAHASGIAREPEDFRGRVLGTALTFGVIGMASAALLGLALRTALL